MQEPEPQLCMIANIITDTFYDNRHYLLTTIEQPWLDRLKLESYAEAINFKGVALNNCRSFIDGTVRLI